MDSAIATSLIAAGSAIGGMAIKTVIDLAIERTRNRKSDIERFIEERKAVYDEFLRLNKDQFRYRAELKKLTLIARAGLQVRPEVTSGFPPSPMEDLVESLEKIRRMARTYEVVQVAERIVRLHGDGAAALRFFLQSDHLTYGLPLFLADRLGEDQTREFVAAYRRDLRIGPPEGASPDFPMIDRDMPMPLVQAEEHLRLHLQHDPTAARDVNLAAPRPLAAEDARLLETPEYRAMILDPGSAS